VAQQSERETETRWPVLIAVIGLGGSFWALPDLLVLVEPEWLIPAAVLGLAVPALVAHLTGHRRLEKILGYGISIIVTLALAGSLALLLRRLPKIERAGDLFRSTAILWWTNVLVFALWYWRLDAGGPHEREDRGAHTEGAFFFPQMMTGAPGLDAQSGWYPRFLDYLFVAFCTSTAFSPTDTPVLSRWAKVLTMIQATISLLCIAVLAASAVGKIKM
jgi:hypothetical protein